MRFWVLFGVWALFAVVSLGCLVALHESSHYAACVNFGGVPSFGSGPGLPVFVKCDGFVGDLSSVFALQETVGYHSFALLAGFWLGLLLLLCVIDSRNSSGIAGKSIG